MTTTKLGPPPVEGLSDVAWARVERGLWTRLDGAGTVTAAAGARTMRPERRSWLWLGAPLAAAAACVVVLLATRSGSGPTSAGEPSATRFVSGATPSAVTLGDAHVTLDAQTAIEVEPDGVALVERGAAWFTSAQHLDVRAGDLHVTAVDARLRVSRDGEVVTVTVDRGAVELHFRGRALSAVAGQSWTSSHPADLARGASLPEPDVGPR